MPCAALASAGKRYSRLMISLGGLDLFLTLFRAFVSRRPVAWRLEKVPS